MTEQEMVRLGALRQGDPLFQIATQLHVREGIAALETDTDTGTKETS